MKKTTAVTWSESKVWWTSSDGHSTTDSVQRKPKTRLARLFRAWAISSYNQPRPKHSLSAFSRSCWHFGQISPVSQSSWIFSRFARCFFSSSL